jgi:hypothetical protein
MTGKLVSRVLMIAGLVAASATISFAQVASQVSHVRRVTPSNVSKQPVAASAVLMGANGSLNKSAMALNLSADQRAKISAMSSETAALQAERTKLWQEYRAITSAPGYSDNIASTQARPRMKRIVEINAQLAPIVARQSNELSAMLSPTQRTAVAQMVTSVKSGL